MTNVIREGFHPSSSSKEPINHVTVELQHSPTTREHNTLLK